MNFLAKAYSKTSQGLLLAVLVCLSIPYFTSQPALASEKIELGDKSFQLGQAYTADFSKYYPSGPNRQDQLGQNIDPSQPSCQVSLNFPYGTKFRLFGTGTSLDGTICVVTGQMNSALVQNRNDIHLNLVSGRQEDIYWKKSGRIRLVAIGDGRNLNFNDSGEYSSDDPKLQTKTETGINLQDDAKARERFFIKNRIIYYNNECDEENEGMGLITADITRAEREEYALRFMTNIGFSLNQAAGMVANMAAESKLMPSCREMGGDPACRLNFYDPITEKHRTEYQIEDVADGQGFGLMQFTDQSEKDTIKLVSEVREKHHFDMDVQLEGLLVQMFTNRIACFYNPKQLTNKEANKALHKAQSPTEAAFTFVDCYGIPRSSGCGWGRKLKGDYSRCYSDVVEKLGQVCNCVMENGQCKEGKKGFINRDTNKKIFVCEITDAIANAVYQQQLNNRAWAAEQLVAKYRDQIEDGEGIDLAEMERIAKEFREDTNRSGFVDNFSTSCKKTPSKLKNPLQDLVARSAWPVICEIGQDRSRNGIFCNAKQPTSFYANLISCRLEGGGSCAFPKVGSDLVGPNRGQDAFGYIATMMQESGWDKTYTKSADELPETWAKIFDVGQVDTSQLRAGDIGIARKPNFDTILFSGDIPGFESPVTSATAARHSDSGRYPSASSAINRANDYAWYRRIK